MTAPKSAMADKATVDEPGPYAYCKQCGRVIVFDDWCFVHLDGWANCRKRDDPGELDIAVHCDPLDGMPISPQPVSVADAYDIPILTVVIAEDGTKHYWSKGKPIPNLTITGGRNG